MGSQRVLVTGASDGIGLALARHYAARGARVYGIGRRVLLAADRQIFAAYWRIDLVQPYAPQLLREALRRAQIERLDLLIQNAALGDYGTIAEQPTASIDALLAVNLHAPIALTHALVPLMSTGGRIVYIGSLAAALPTPDYAVYAATKAALEGFARTLRVELRGQVLVQIIHPGATRTALHARSGAPLEQIGWWHFPSPERMVPELARAIDSRRALVTLGSGNRVLRLLGRYGGSIVDHAIAWRRSVQG
jgi:short-subunit dehydrogenase